MVKKTGTSKLIWSISFCFLASGLFAQQTIHGILIDNSSKVPIAFAAIGMNGFSSTSISNIDGVFSLTTTGNADSLVVSHLNYGLQAISYQKNTADTQLFHIDPKDILLDELIVSDVPVSTLLSQAVQRSQKKLSRPIVLNTYYREFVKTNAQYTKFSDGLLNYHLQGKEKLKSDMEVIDSRAIELYDESDENMDWDMTSLLDVRKSADIAFVSKIGAFLDEKNFEKYDYLLRSRKDKNGDSYQIISFTPKPEIKEDLREGSVTIDSKSGLILELEYWIPDSHIAYSKQVSILVMNAKMTAAKFKLIFRQTESEYYLFYVFKEVEMHIWNKKKFDDKFLFTSDLIVTNFQTTNIQFNKKNSYSKKSLYDRKATTIEEFWLTHSSIPLTAEQQQVIAELNKSAIPNKD